MFFSSVPLCQPPTPPFFPPLQSWVAQQTKKGIITNAIDNTGCRDKTLEITPSSLMQYLEAVVLPLEWASSTAEPSKSTTTDLAKNGKGASSVIETYLRPVLQLWQHQYQHQEEQQRQERQRQRQSHCHPDPSSSSSSVTLSSEPKSIHESLSDDRAVVLNVQHAVRQQDQLQRLIQLEKSHQDTALVISQLQDQVQRLVDDRARQKRFQLHSHQEKDQNVLRASDKSGSNGTVSLAALTEQHTDNRGYSPSLRRHHQRQQCQQQQTNGYYGHRGETHRAEELIEVIAKGLEEYHARANYERTRQRSETDVSAAGHDHSSWRHIDLSSENAVELSPQPQSPHDSAVDYHHYEQEQEIVDRSLGSHQRERTLYYKNQSPMQLQHPHHHLHGHSEQQQLQTQQLHAEIHREDLLEVPPHHALHDRPVRSRKRSSSMSEPSGSHKENIKQARSCSPPRTTSDAPRAAPERFDATAVVSVVSNSHTPSQPPIESLEKNGRQGLRLEECHDSPKSSINPETSASSTAAASLAMLHFGSVDRARQHSVSLQHVDHYTHQQSTHPYTASDQRPQAPGDIFLDGYSSRPPPGHDFNFTSTQTTRVAPPPYGEDDYRSHPEHSHPPIRHHSHPSQSYPHLEDMIVQCMPEPARYESHGFETQISSYSHPTSATKAFTETQLPVFRGKHTKSQESFGFTNRIELVQHRRKSHPSPLQPASALTSVSKPHPYQRDESRIYSGHEHQQHQQNKLPQLSRRHDPSDEDIKSPRLQLKEYQHQHPQHHHYHPHTQQQLSQQQQQSHHHHQLQHHILYHPQQQHQQQHQQQQQHHHHNSHHHDMHHQQSLQSSSTSSPPLSSSSNQHQHQHHPPPPIYVMNRQVNTVPELWKEWTVGLGGGPSIRQLEAQYGPSWRTSSSAANFFSRRLRIIHEIQRVIDYEGLTEEEAVKRLEARREQGVVVPGTEGHSAITLSSDTAGGGTGMSLHRLSEILRKKQL